MTEASTEVSRHQPTALRSRSTGRAVRSRQDDLSNRIGCERLRSKVMSAESAALLITSGSTVGMSGFTGAGYPKALPVALAARIAAEHAAGHQFRVRVWTGASTGPELDGALAKVDCIEFRLPYNSDPTVRDKINRGEMEYFDMHLSQVAPMAWQGFLGPLDTAVIEVTGIQPDGGLIPSSSVGNNKTWLERATQVILEVNSWQNAALEGMHDIYYGTALPPDRVPIPLVRPDNRIGETCFRCDPDKIVAIIEVGVDVLVERVEFWIVALDRSLDGALKANDVKFSTGL
jgi:succinyl-CoA:acetate CoA-transferase